MVAITDQSAMNDADVEFEISMFQYERCGVTCAFEEGTRDGFVRASGGGKLIFQKSSVS